MDHIRVYDLSTRVWYAASASTIGEFPLHPEAGSKDDSRVAYLTVALENLKHAVSDIEQELKRVVG